MAVLYVQVAHRGKLFRAGSVQDLQDTWRTVHLRIRTRTFQIADIDDEVVQRNPFTRRWRQRRTGDESLEFWRKNTKDT